MHAYTTGRGLTGKFSARPLAVVAEPFKDWQKAFWDNLATTVQLHNIKRVIAIDHRDCSPRWEPSEASGAASSTKCQANRADLLNARCA